MTTSAGRLPASFAALRYRNYRLWFFGQMLSLMGTWMQSVAQGWVVFELTGSELALGTITFVGTLPTLFLMLPAGALADRVPKRNVLLFTQSFMMLNAAAITILSALGILQIWHIALLAAVGGLAQSFDAPARQSLAVEMVDDRRDLTSAIALNSTMFNLARIAGPAIAGILLAALGATWCFGVNCVSFLAVIIALVYMRVPAVAIVQTQEGLKDRILAGLRYVWGHPHVRTIILLMGVVSLFGLSYNVLLPAFAVSVLHAGETGLGSLNSAMGLGALVGSLTVASLARFNRKARILTLGNLLLPLFLLLFAFSRWMPLSLVALSLVGWAWVTQAGLSNTLVQTMVPDELRGRVMAVYMLVFFGSSPFGSLQAGALAQAFGPAMGVGIGAVVVLLFALGLFIFVPSLRKLEGV